MQMSARSETGSTAQLLVVPATGLGSMWLSVNNQQHGPNHTDFPIYSVTGCATTQKLISVLFKALQM
jgi:hypothetical protein